MISHSILTILLLALIAGIPQPTGGQQQFFVRNFTLGNGNWVQALTVLGDDLFAGGQSINFVRHWKLNDIGFSKDYSAPNGCLRGLASNGSHLFVGQYNDSILMYQLGSNTLAGIFSFSYGANRLVSLAISGNYLFSGHINGMIYQYQISSLSLLRIISSVPASGTADLLIVNGPHLFAAGSAAVSQIRQWQIDSGQLMYQFGAGNVTSMAIFSDSIFTVNSGLSPTLYQWSISGRRLVQQLYQNSSVFISGIAISGDYLFATASDNSLKQFKITTLSERRTIGNAGIAPGALVISNPFVFSGDSNGVIRQWLIPELPRIMTTTLLPNTVTPTVYTLLDNPVSVIMTPRVTVALTPFTKTILSTVMMSITVSGKVETTITVMMPTVVSQVTQTQQFTVYETAVQTMTSITP